MSELSNKKILLFAPNFFGYDKEIKKKLEERGAKVDLYDERPSSNVFIKAIIRIYKNLLNIYIWKYFENICKKNSSKDYDFIVVIKGEVFNISIVEKLKNAFSKAKLILYLWDSINNYDNIKQCLHLFDNTLTFDQNDSNEISSLKFRPLFFIDDYGEVEPLNADSNKFKYDLLFIGTVHSDRWSFLKKIREQASKYNLKIYYYLYVQSPLVFIVRKIFDKRFRSIPISNVWFKSISKEQIVKLTTESKAVLDIQHSKQSGLTMRTLEVFGAKRKLITTNSDIKNYDLFTIKNIKLIDRFKPQINFEFLKDDYIPLSSDIYYKYSIDGWIDELFDL
jgi:hypothetical protein